MAWKAPKIVEVSVGMEINMYAQVSLDGDDLPGSTSTFCFRTGAGVLQSKVVYPVHFEKLIGAFALMSAPDWPRTRRRFRADSRPHQTFNRHFWRG
jgi:coenzyme PQQ precursor peptide PqqA